MAVMDEFKEERAKVKEMSFRERVDHFIYYHKVGIMMVVLVLIIGGIGIYDAVTGKDPALYVALVDCFDRNYDSDSDYEYELGTQLGVDTDYYEVILDTSYVLSAAQNANDTSAYEIAEVLSTRLATRQLNVFMAAESIFNGWVMNDAFLDLREVLTPEQIEYYEDSFYYVDYEIIENYELDFDKGAYVYDEDHRSTEGMKEPIPVGIYLTPTDEFNENYQFMFDEEIIFAITFNTADAYADYATGFLDIISGRAAETAN